MAYFSGDSDSGDNYTYIVDLQMSDADGELAEVEVTHSINQDDVSGSDEDLLYPILPGPDPENNDILAENGLSDLGEAAVDELVAEAAGQLGIPERVLRNKIQQQAAAFPPNEDAFGGLLPDSAIRTGGTGVTQATETVPVAQVVIQKPPDVPGLEDFDGLGRNPKLRFNTEPTATSNDLVPEFGTERASVAVDMALEQFIQFEDVGEELITPGQDLVPSFSLPDPPSGTEDTLDFGVDLTNNGDVPYDARFSVGGGTAQETIDPGETQTLTTSTRVIAGETYEPTVEVAGEEIASETFDASSPLPEFPAEVLDFDIQRPSLDTIKQGEPPEFVADITNTGSETHPVTFDAFGAQASETLSPGQSTTLTATPDVQPGETFRPTLSSEGDTFHRAREFTFPDSPPEPPEPPGAPDLAIVGLSPNLDFANPDEVPIEVAIENQGDAPGEETFRIFRNGNNAGTVDANLDPGERRTETVRVGTPVTGPLEVSTSDPDGPEITIPRSDFASEPPEPPEPPETPGDPPETVGPGALLLGNDREQSIYRVEVLRSYIDDDDMAVDVAVSHQSVPEAEQPYRTDIEVYLDVVGFTDQETLDVLDGQTKTTTLTVGQVGPGSVNIRDAEAGQFGVTSSVPVTPPEQPDPASLEITDVSIPEQVPLGETAPAEFTVRNTGGRDADVDVEGAGLDERVTIPGGGARTFSPTISQESPGDKELQVDVTNADAGVTKTISRTVGVGTPDLSLDSIDVPEMVTPGDDIPVDVTLSNAGGAPGEALVEVNPSREVTVPAGATDTVSLSVPMQSQAQTLSLTVRDQTLGEDIASRSVTVQPALPDLSLADVAAPDTAPPDEAVDVSATVRNNGDAPGAAEVSIAGEPVTARVAPGGEETVTGQVAPTDAGERSVTVEAVNDATGDSIGRQSVTIAPERPDFALSEIEAPDEVLLGEPATVSATVRNSGAVAGDALVTIAGEEQTLSIPPGRTRTAAAEVTPDTAADQSVTVSVTDQGRGTTAAQRSVRIGTLTERLQLTAINTPNAVAYDERPTVEAVVENTGDASGDAVVRINGATQRVTVPAGDTRTTTTDLDAPGTDSTSVDVELVNQRTGETAGSRSTTIQSQVPQFSLGDVQFPTDIVPGEAADIIVPVENTGQAAGEATVEANGETYTERIRPGETQQFNVEVSPEDALSRSVNINVINEVTGSGDDNTSGQISTAESEFTVREVRLPDEARAGETVSGDLRIANDGSSAGRAQVSAGNTNETISLDVGEERTIGFSVVKAPNQTQEVTITVRDLQGGFVDTTRTRTLNLIEEAPEPPEEAPTEPPDDDFGLGDLLSSLPDPLDIIPDSDQ